MPLDPEQFAGIQERLKRAKQNIVNLDGEIVAFLNEFGTEGTVTHQDYERFKEWLKSHFNRDIPQRFGVLAGEIVHHLRSVLDHIAWGLSSDSYRSSHRASISFPIERTSPDTWDEKKTTRFNGKIQGFTSVKAKTLVIELQPYRAPEPLDEPLTIINDLDRLDKHQTLVIIFPMFQRSITIPLSVIFSERVSGFSDEQEVITPPPAFKAEIKYAKQIAFAQFGKRKNEPVVPSLTNLLHVTENIVRLFSADDM